MNKRYSKRVQRGQAMVEFALTSMLFILVIVSIIELARIMHAYVTIQHAARVAARYAVTGQWMEEYANNPSDHYDPDSSEPYARIYPCWPRFYDDPLPKAQTPRGADYYEPYRGPRTCSVEKQALQQMRTLGLVPDAGFNQPGHYDVVVSSPSPDSTPTNGEFSRNGETLSYAAYYDNENPTAEMVRGYAGKPNGQVIVQIRYNIRLVTPLLANMVPSIPLQVRVVMTNEAFGSTSVLTEAAPAPNMLPVGPLHQPIASDLKFVANQTMNTSGNTNPGPSNPITYKVTITNSGELNAITAFQTCLYASKSEGLTSTELRVQSNRDAMKQFGCYSTSRLEAGMDGEGTLTAGGWTEEDAGWWYIYAVVDPGTTGGEVEGNVDEKGTDPEYPEHEKNNWLYIEKVEVGKGVNLALSVNIPNPDGNEGTPKYTVGQDFNIEVTVSNINGDHDVNGLTVYLPPLPPELTAIPGNGFDGQFWSNVTVPMDGSVLLTAAIHVNAASGPPVTIRVEIPENYLPEGYYQKFATNWPISGSDSVNLQNP